MRLRLPCSLKHDAAACIWFDISALLPVCVCVCVCGVCMSVLYICKNIATLADTGISLRYVSLCLYLCLYMILCVFLSPRLSVSVCNIRI